VWRVAHLARGTYLGEIDKQKKQHWKDFLDDPTKIWEAGSYAKPPRTPMDVPELVANGRRYVTD
jgi:hypothetical protein